MVLLHLKLQDGCLDLTPRVELLGRSFSILSELVQLLVFIDFHLTHCTVSSPGPRSRIPLITAPLLGMMNFADRAFDDRSYDDQSEEASKKAENDHERSICVCHPVPRHKHAVNPW